MRVAVYHNNSDVRIEERPAPSAGVGEIVVQTRACGVCVADTMEWYLTPRAPLTLGHEATGVISHVGRGVVGLKEGDRVFVHHHVPCLTCDHCRRGNFTMCATFRKTRLEPGGFSEHFLASPAHVTRDTLVLPKDLSFEAATLIEPLACVLHAIRKAEVRPEDSVALIGAGVMGILFIEALIGFGITRLVVYEAIQWRRERAEKAGAPVVLEPLPDAREEATRLNRVLSTRGVDRVFVAAGNTVAIEMGLSFVKEGGTLCVFATPHPSERLQISPSDMFFRECRIMGSYSADHLDTRLALDLLEGGRIAGDAIITHRFRLEELSSAILQTAIPGEHLKSVICM
ncbi:MAG: alcohol dehydrogenase catalytic domain-containing protein [Ignavibacteriales bacterium]